jgi:nicotinamide riboside transporter PnuC
METGMIAVLKYILNKKTKKYKNSIEQFREGNVEISGYDPDWDNILEIIIIVSFILSVIVLVPVSIIYSSIHVFPTILLALIMSAASAIGLTLLFIGVAWLLVKYYEYKQDYLNSKD